MQEETIKKVRVLLGAGVDDDTIISTLNISLNDLESIKSDGIVQYAGAPLPQQSNGEFVGKITPENYQTFKQLITDKPMTVTVSEFCEEHDLSLPTYYRIKKHDTYEGYRSNINEESRKAKSRKYGNGRNKRMIMTRERYNSIKAELKDWKDSVSAYCKETGVSHASAWRVKTSNSFDDYIEKYAPRYKGYEPTESSKLTIEEAVKIIEPYAIPKTNEERRADRKEAYETAKAEQVARVVPTQVEVLERIATQLERLADYEQMKLSKKRWFRK